MTEDGVTITELRASISLSLARVLWQVRGSALDQEGRGHGRFCAPVGKLLGTFQLNCSSTSLTP